MDYMLLIVAVLLVLAIADIVVGVSNDAVNFLNSAIGSKVTTYRNILLIASAGILAGCFFSSGMMEIARKGIFQPQHFTFDKVMWIFLAVMLADIVLFDIFNALGLPTSTTVSIVFELLGAAAMVGFLFAAEKGEPIGEVMKYINMESTFSIISGIFLSILIAFTAGVAVQYFIRSAFTFQYEKRLNNLGAPFSGMGITVIIYFLLIKGLKGTTLAQTEWVQALNDNIAVFMLLILVVTTAICFWLQRQFQVNPIKIVVIAGTFSLAMAFAGNDLVNFIGVPIAGLMAYQNWAESGVAADALYQDYLATSDVIVPAYMLGIAGLVMALTIWLSAKAKKVTETEISLGKQDEDGSDDRFKPNNVSRRVVKTAMLLGNLFDTVIPRNVKRRYNLSFERDKLSKATRVDQDAPAFDLIRAGTNLVLASILIAWATSLKLPLSTTYVTFMVAMGTSLADRAWGRESAVYRVTGVLSVIGGWFITALFAFSVAAFFAFVIYQGMLATGILLGIVVIYIVISNIKFAHKERQSKKEKSRLSLLEEPDLDVYMRSKNMLVTMVVEVSGHYSTILNGIRSSDAVAIRKADKELSELINYTYKLKRNSLRAIRQLGAADRRSAEVIVHGADLIQDMLQSAKFLSTESLQYIENLHEPLANGFITTLENLGAKMDRFFRLAINELNEEDGPDIPSLRQNRNEIRTFINTNFGNELDIIRRKNIGSKQALLQTSIFLQSRDIQAVLFRICKIYGKFEN
ncbi:inorganic phosphate transporter [Parapedobacter sp. ISTM3]|uniref:inorganic phosphate transporter n=1 Tax=Parapedobacter sp. ISTM3 TaxID=2800130 RepID=UPI0019046126|nr:inorganic phosphate transporter [Parapedobacter sp. ISTM3]MBK1441395.1 inorganic phosphate transporter [Parapedobacter sp. ISTM3]